MSFYETLVRARRRPLIGKLAYLTLKLLGAEIPCSVEIGEGFLLHHGGFGVVIHPRCRIGKRVGIYPGVTLGRADIHRPADLSLRGHCGRGRCDSRQRGEGALQGGCTHHRAWDYRRRKRGAV